jgi:hypothetical protein
MRGERAARRNEKPQPIPGRLAGAKSNASCETLLVSRAHIPGNIRARVNLELGE